MHELARALVLSFLQRIDDACAEHRIPCRGGYAILDSHRRLLWDANHIRVESLHAPAAEALAAAAEQHLGGESFRMITLLHEQAALGLADSLTAHGYRRVDQAIMVLDSTPPAPIGTGIAVQSVPRDALTPSRGLALLSIAGQEREAVRQLVARDAIVATVVRERCFAVIDRGQVVAHCQLYSDGSVAQIEHVYTLPDYRCRGYASALVAHAARLARATGAVHVFTLVDAGGWQQEFAYELGFVEAGRLPRFLLVPEQGATRALLRLAA